MLITREVTLDTDEFEIGDFDFSFDELKESVSYLSNEEQKKMAIAIIEPLNRKEIKDVFASILENLSIDDAKELIKELYSQFLSLEEYRERAAKFQRSNK